MQRILQRAQGQQLSLICFQLSFKRHDAGGLVPEAHLTTLLVFDEMCGEHVALRPPWPKQHHELAKSRIPRL